MKRLLCLLLALTMLLAFAACGSEPAAGPAAEPADEPAAQEPAGAEPADAEPADAEPRTLTIGHASKVADGFDPAASNNEMGLDLVYDTLFVRNPDNGNAVEGLLAESYEYQDDCTLVIQIAENAAFSNGDPVTAADCLFSLQRVATSQGMYMDYYKGIDYTASTADGKTLTLVTAQPMPMLLAYLSMPYASILCQAYVESIDAEAFWDKPVGSGPYACVENVSGSHTTYALREDYWGAKPDYDGITVNNYTDQTAMFVDFETGILDAVFDLSASDAKRLQNGEMQGATLNIAPSYNAIAFALPEYTEAFADIRVRQAITEAIDVVAVSKVAFDILCTPSTSVVADGIDYHIDAAGSLYNPEHAKQLLAEAGYADGLELKLVICAVDFQEKISTAIQAMLSEVGVTLNIESYDIPTAVGMFMSGDTDVVINAQTAAALDPAQVFFNIKNGSTNKTVSLSDETLNGYLTTGETNMDDAVRQEAYENAQIWMAENYWEVPIADRSVAYAFSESVASLNTVTPQEPNLRFAKAA